MIDRLIQNRNERGDGFAKLIRTPMGTKLTKHAEGTTKALNGRGIPARMIKEAGDQGVD